MRRSIAHTRREAEMHVPKWYGKSGTVDLDAFEAEALPFRRQLVADGVLLPRQEMSEQWAARNSTNVAISDSFAVDVDGKWYVPTFLLDPALSPKAFEDILALLGDLPAWSKFHFFTSKNASLGGVTPLDSLRQGNPDRVNRAARAFAER